MLNKVILMGRLVRDPELRHTVTNTPVASFTIAVERYEKTKDGNRVSDFIDCTSWGRQAEFVKQWFTKGMLAIVVGRVQSRNWQDKNGNKRTSIEVNTDEVKFGESKKDKQSAPAAPDMFPELDDSGCPF